MCRTEGILHAEPTRTLRGIVRLKYWRKKRKMLTTACHTTNRDEQGCPFIWLIFSLVYNRVTHVQQKEIEFMYLQGS